MEKGFLWQLGPTLTANGSNGSNGSFGCNRFFAAQPVARLELELACGKFGAKTRLLRHCQQLLLLLRRPLVRAVKRV
jgi:hypothetical protein